MTRHEKYDYNLYEDKVHRDIRAMVSKCLYCGVEEYKIGKRKQTNLAIHHLDGDKANNDLGNITVLCIKCHNGVAHSIIREGNRIKTTKLNQINVPTLEVYNDSRI